MALARLVDAQQRFSKGPVTLEKKSGKQRINGAVQEPHYISQEEEMRGFVGHPPQLQRNTGRKAIQIIAELPVDDPAIPSFEVILSAAPSVGLRVPLDLRLRTDSVRPWVLVEPEPEPVASPLLPVSRLSVVDNLLKPEPAQAVEEETLPASDPAGLLATAELVATAGAVPAVRSIEAAPEPFAAPAPVLPTSALPASALLASRLNTGLMIPGSALEPRMALGELSSCKAGAGFVEPMLAVGTPAGLDFLSRQLIAVEPVTGARSDAEAPAKAGAEAHSEASLLAIAASLRAEDQAAPPPAIPQPEIKIASASASPGEGIEPSVKPIRLKAPEAFFAPALPMRKPRVREVFFPLPKVGTLPEMATRVWRTARPNTSETTQELLALSWIVQTVHEPEPLPYKTPEWKELSGKYALLSSSPQHLPKTQQPAELPGCVLRSGERLDMVSPVADAGDRSLSAKEPPLEWAVAREIACSPRTPAIGANLAVYVRVLDCQMSLEPPSVMGNLLRKQVEATPIELENAVARMLPQARRTTANFALRQTSALATLEASSQSTSTSPLRPEEPVAYPADRDSIPVVCPQSRMVQEFQPSAHERMVALGYSSVSAVAMAQLGPTYKDIKSLWPEPVRQMPRMKTSVVEDASVREAVKSIPLGRDKGLNWRPSLPVPKLPSLPAIQFSRLPDWKWTMFLVPALLLVGLISVFTPETEQVASVKDATAVESAPDSSNEEPKPETLSASAGKPTAVTPSPVPGPSTAEESAPAPVAEVLAAPVEQAKARKANFLTASLNNLRQTLLKRAAISFSDDFRSGLAEWEGKGDWSKQWSYDDAGFVRTGPLAIYRPTIALTDYDMNLLGQIEKKSIGWVYRAKDLENYYVTKITLSRGGPLPEAVVERYAVIQGKQSSYERRPLPLQVRTDTVYPINMNVKGSDFTLRVQGQIVDYWNDSRLKSGGVGLFSARGEQARVRWIEVSHQYDTLGKLCAFLAPYSIPAREGSSR